MNKKELQRMLQQNFAQAKQPKVSVQSEWQAKIGEWQQIIQQATEEDIEVTRQKILESIQAFITTRLLEVVNKNTFQLKEGTIYQQYYTNLEALKTNLVACTTLTELIQALEG
ncbi:hypothetical protein [uncultured Microscilla sp.]|uniref:hypothetical protein n=1 Tax=uncultured Microscilla sp. TaxID=432653 RepID=UPI00261C4226|nr:hypothetical protein [uncultured Microscilla sp.]